MVPSFCPKSLCSDRMQMVIESHGRAQVRACQGEIMIYGRAANLLSHKNERDGKEL